MNTFFFSYPKAPGTDPGYKKGEKLVRELVTRLAEQEANAKNRGNK